MSIVGTLALGCGGRSLGGDGGAGDSTVAQEPIFKDATVAFDGLPPPLTPLSIPPAPASGNLRLCGSTAALLPIGFLPDGRAVIAQYAEPRVTLIRAWDSEANALETLMTLGASDRSGIPYPAHELRIANDGHLIAIASDATGFEVYNVSDGKLLTQFFTYPRTMIVDVSADGWWAIDTSLKRWDVRDTAGGAPFDFRALLPSGVAFSPSSVSMSPSGNAVAVVASATASPQPFVAVLFDDGRTVILSDNSWPPPGGQACISGVCPVRWSQDGGKVLVEAYGSLRVWEIDTRTVLLREDAGVHSATFSPSGQTVVIVRDPDQAIVERHLSDGSRFAWGFSSDWRSAQASIPIFDVTGRRLLFLGHRQGDLGQGLVLARNDGKGAFWRSVGPMLGGLAVAGDALFGLMEDGTAAGEWQILLARYPAVGGPPTHLLQPGESQSEFAGQIVASPDERRLAVVFPDSVRVVDVTTLGNQAVIPSGAGMAAWSPDGGYLATTPDLHYRDTGRPPVAEPAKQVSIWDATSGQLVTRVAVPVVPERLAFDDRGSTLLVWGHPSVLTKGKVGEIQTFSFVGDPISIESDIVSGRWMPSAVGPFVAGTRDMVVTGSRIVAVSTGLTVAAFFGPAFDRAVFSADFSVLLGVDRDESTFPPPFRMVGVKDGRVIASGLTQGLPDGVFSHAPGQRIALSRDGLRVAIASRAGIVTYCLDTDVP